MVVRDFAMTETANFWQKGRLVQRGELRPEDVGTEVFFLPAALAGEKDGTVTNTSRLVQWHDAVLKAPGDSRSDLWFIYHLGKRLKQLYADSKEPRDAAIHALTWLYPERGDRAEPDAEAILREINGYTVADRKQIPGFQQLKDDGSTACGGWMYCGVYPRDGHNIARSRKPDGPNGLGSHLRLGVRMACQPPNAVQPSSADPAGKPWSERKKMIWWDEEAGKWTGPMCRISSPLVAPITARTGASGRAAWTRSPAMIHSSWRPTASATVGPSGLKDGPLPTHYEPPESPVKNPLYGQQVTIRSPSFGPAKATSFTSPKTHGSRTFSAPTG